PQRALVRVVVAMAVEALALRVVELRRLVAARALDLLVLAEQREAAEVMVEAHVLLPGDFAVARGAALAELPGVRIVSAMATDAVFRGLRHGDVLDMARGALRRRVRAVQREVRVARVIERDVRPFGDLMAVGALHAVAARVVVVVGVAA